MQIECADGDRPALLSIEELARRVGSSDAEDCSLCLQHLRVAEKLSDLVPFGFTPVPVSGTPDRAELALGARAVLVIRTMDGNTCGPDTRSIRIVSVSRRDKR